MKSEIETITPIQAQKYLAKNLAHNRQIRPTWVKSLAKAILRGDWRLTHQPIAFDTSGNLFDGQHRLHAIIQANTAVQVLVVRGVDPGAFTATDIGAKRSVSDLLQISKMEGATMSFLTRVLLGENTSISMVAEARRMFSSDYSVLMFAASGSSRVFSSAPVQSAAICALEIFGDKDGRIPKLYADLVHRNYPELPPAGLAFVRQMDSSHDIEARGNWALFVRAFSVFNPDKAFLSKTQVNRLPDGSYPAITKIRGELHREIASIREGAVG